MLGTFSPPYETGAIDYSWDQLTLGINAFNSYPDIIEELWPKIVGILAQVRDIEIQNPKDEAWFHLRRTARSNAEQSSISQALARIEIFRLKRGSLTQQTQEKIRLLPKKFNDVICAGWWPLNFIGRHDNAFLSFLHKLSVLRGRDLICYPNFLGHTPTAAYEECPFCREAYQVMMAPSKPWSKTLEPWFLHMASAAMDENRVYEYAHWFGHILSGWP